LKKYQQTNNKKERPKMDALCYTENGLRTELFNQHTKALVGINCFRQAQATLAEPVEAKMHI
jgi:hypothetical protein